MDQVHGAARARRSRSGRRGRGFSYTDASGDPVAATDRRRIEVLAIPPAWTDVWICADARGHLQATGRDDRGRKQYRYHARWREVRDGAKFDQLADFGAALPRLRSAVADDLARPGVPPEKVVALVVALLDRTLIRVGNEVYRRENGSFGLTTLEARHVDVSGTTIEFDFVGKGGRHHSSRLRDRRLAAAVRACHELGGRELFTYLGPDDEPVRVDSADWSWWPSTSPAERPTYWQRARSTSTMSRPERALLHLLDDPPNG